MVLAVLTYAHLYFHYERYNQLFQCLLVSFTLTMFAFLFASNCYVQLVLWEWLGLQSFMLIQFWGIRQQAACGALKALILNRCTDLLVIAWSLVFYCSQHFPSFNAVATYFLTEYAGFWNLVLFGGILVKVLALGIHH